MLVSAIGFASAGCDPEPLTLSDQDSGHEVAVAMDEAVEITLHTIGPGSYGTPTISSSIVSFDGLTYPGPAVPGGPIQRYQFTATAEGSAVLTIPFDGVDGHAPFTLTVRCCTR